MADTSLAGMAYMRSVYYSTLSNQRSDMHFQEVTFFFCSSVVCHNGFMVDFLLRLELHSVALNLWFVFFWISGIGQSSIAQTITFALRSLFLWFWFSTNNPNRLQLFNSIFRSKQYYLFHYQTSQYFRLIFKNWPESIWLAWTTVRDTTLKPINSPVKLLSECNHK